MTRDKLYQQYLRRYPNGNFTRFTRTSKAGLRSLADGPVEGSIASDQSTPPDLTSPRDHLAVGPPARHPTVRMDHNAPEHGDAASDTELRRKLAWAVGTVWGVPYSNYDSWPAQYARLASARLLELHGTP